MYIVKTREKTRNPRSATRNQVALFYTEEREGEREERERRRDERRERLSSVADRWTDI